MSTQAPPRPVAPPNERFWQRYSPRHELPLSGVGSLTLHAAALGAVVIFALGVFRPGGGGSGGGGKGSGPRIIVFPPLDGGNRGGEGPCPTAPRGEPSPREAVPPGDTTTPPAEPSEPAASNTLPRPKAEEPKLKFLNAAKDQNQEGARTLAGQLAGLHTNAQKALSAG